MTSEPSDGLRDKFMIEEYKELRAEIRHKDASMTQILLVGLVANVTLISGISAFYFNVYAKSPSDIMPALSYFFLGPTIIIIPLLAILTSHRKDIRLLGSYIHAFHEEVGHGAKWETAHDKRADHETEEAHDFVPITLWALLGICLALYWYSLFLCLGNGIYKHLASPLPIIVIMAEIHETYNKGKHQYYRKALDLWRRIRPEITGVIPNIKRKVDD